MAHKAVFARQEVEPLPAKNMARVTWDDVARMIADAIAAGGGTGIVLKDGQGIKIEAALNQGVMEYTIKLDMALESANENLTITTKETP